MHRRDDQLQIDEYVEIGGVAAMGQLHIGVANLEYFQSILVHTNQLERRMSIHAARAEANFSEMRSFIQQKTQILNNNIQVFGGTIEGGFRLQHANTGRQLHRLEDAPVEALELMHGVDMATLSNNPKSLVELWREYQFGIDGRKAAQNFTTAERNRRTGGIKQK